PSRARSRAAAPATVDERPDDIRARPYHRRSPVDDPSSSPETPRGFGERGEMGSQDPTWDAFRAAEQGPSADPIWWLWLLVAVFFIAVVVWLLEGLEPGRTLRPGVEAD